MPTQVVISSYLIYTILLPWTFSLGLNLAKFLGNENKLCLLNIQSQIDFLLETIILGILAKRVHNEFTNTKRTTRWMFSSVCGGCVTLINLGSHHMCPAPPFLWIESQPPICKSQILPVLYAGERTWTRLLKEFGSWTLVAPASGWVLIPRTTQISGPYPKQRILHQVGMVSRPEWTNSHQTTMRDGW